MNRPEKAIGTALWLGGLLLVVGLAVGLPGVRANAQSGGGYDLSWWTVDGGGATFHTGGGYSLGGTAGQADGAVWAANGYTLTGGFWGGAVAVPYVVYLPLVMHSP